MDSANEFWSLNEGAFSCLIDETRCEAFRKAIQNTVSPGDVVVDLGAGTGILSMFAVDAGAARVYAIELDGGNFRTLERSVRANGYDEKIICIRGDVTTIQFPEKPDVIICEMIATGLVEELQVPAMRNALRQCSASAKYLINKYTIWADAVYNNNKYYGKTFQIVRYEFTDLERTFSVGLTDRVAVSEVDLCDPGLDSSISCNFRLIVENDGIINGLRLGGITMLHDGSTFDHSFSYSFPMILPINDILVKRGQTLAGCINYRLCEGPEMLEWTLDLIDR